MAHDFHTTNSVYNQLDLEDQQRIDVHIFWDLLLGSQTQSPLRNSNLSWVIDEQINSLRELYANDIQTGEYSYFNRDSIDESQKAVQVVDMVKLCNGNKLLSPVAHRCRTLVNYLGNLPYVDNTTPGTEPNNSQEWRKWLRDQNPGSPEPSR